jgi:hypothetical protein
MKSSLQAGMMTRELIVGPGVGYSDAVEVTGWLETLVSQTQHHCIGCRLTSEASSTVVGQ